MTYLEMEKGKEDECQKEKNKNKNKDLFFRHGRWFRLNSCDG